MTLLPARKSLTPTGDPNTYYNKGETDALLSGKASTDLTNLSSTGQMIIDSQNGTISNCVLEIPQNIKVTLENNVLTVKSGSILTLTGSTYATATTNHDVARTYNSLADGRYFIFMAGNLGSLGTARKISDVGSGDTVPDSSSSLTAFYNTADKKMYVKENNVWSVWNVVYPLCIIEASDGVVSFAKDSNGNDMIFNGACFVGHHAVVYPNIKVLIPNGINDDGSLASINVLKQSLEIIDLGTNTSFSLLFRPAGTIQRVLYQSHDKKSELQNVTSTIQYVAETNSDWIYSSGVFIEQFDNSTRIQFINYSINSNSIVTDFTIRQPVRTATVEMLKDKQDVLTFDSTPTASSTNPVTSGGVYTALNDKQNDITLITGYDATKTQTLKNVSGVLTWIDDE